LVRNTFVRKVQVVETTSLQLAQIPYFRNSRGQKQGQLDRPDSGTLVLDMWERRSRSPPVANPADGWRNLACLMPAEQAAEDLQRMSSYRFSGLIPD
jgi:hypothetical protein